MAGFHSELNWPLRYSVFVHVSNLPATSFRTLLQLALQTSQDRLLCPLWRLYLCHGVISDLVPSLLFELLSFYHFWGKETAPVQTPTRIPLSPYPRSYGPRIETTTNQRLELFLNVGVRSNRNQSVQRTFKIRLPPKSLHQAGLTILCKATSKFMAVFPSHSPRERYGFITNTPSLR